MADKKKLDKTGHGAHSGRPKDKDANPDPITGAPGAHPIGTGLGAAGAGAAGAAIGAAGGPVGAVIGGAVGAVVGGLAGKGAGELVNPTVEDEYWQTNYANRPYVEEGKTYDYYRPAYEFGWTSRGRFAGKKFEDCEVDLRRDWEKTSYSKNYSWDRARFPVREAWDRLDRSGQTRMTLAEEQVSIDKRQVSAGEVAVKKTVETEQVQVPVTRRREEVEIERRPATGMGLTGQPTFGKDEIRVPLTEEQIDVQKTPVVKEEIIIKKKAIEDTTNVRTDVKKEKLDIDRRERPLGDEGRVAT